MREPLATRWRIGRPAILLGLAFLVGIGLGWVVTRPFAVPSVGPVTNDEYVSVVAQLFQRDHNQEVARERLALLGSPTVLVQQTVQDVKAGNLKSQSDQAAVTALAQVLAPSASSEAGASTSATTGSQPNQAAATPAANDQTTSAPASSGQSSWLGPIVAFILAFGLGVVVLLRTAGLSLASLPILNRLTRPRPPERPARSRPVIASVPAETTPFRRGRDLNAARGFERVLDDDRSEVRDEPPPSRSTGRTATLLRPRVAAIGAARRLSFESLYRLGDEPYDEIHPITDPASGALVAACGLSSALAIESDTASRYYAFTAWVQDYVSGEQLRAVGLVTPSAMDRARAQIDEWVREGQVDDVLAVRGGVKTDLSTDTITTTVAISDLDRAEGGGPNEHFTRLGVRFEVRWNDDQA
ncbi:MAG: hypothetical protein ACRDIY_16000 [Chloroflexota bacterium]